MTIIIAWHLLYIECTYVPCVPKVTNVPNSIITPMYASDVLNMIRSYIL